MSTPAGYALGQHRDAEAEIARLRVQADVVASAEETVFRQLGLPDQGLALDLGCGPGFVADRLRRTRPGLRIVGLDRDRRSLTDARSRLPVAQADATRLPFPDGAFDCVYARLVLRYLARPDSALRELRRVLRPGGVLLVLDGDDGALVVHPAPAGFADALAARQQTLIRRGADPFFARRLPGLLAGAALADVCVRPFCFSSADVGPAAFAAIMLAPAADAVDLDLLDREVAEAAARGTAAWAAGPHAFGMTTVLIASGRRPAG